MIMERCLQNFYQKLCRAERRDTPSLLLRRMLNEKAKL
jgi:hypothetical protein